MRISETIVSLRLNAEGDRVLQRAGLPKEAAVGLKIQEQDDVGLWARFRRHGDEYFLLIRWEHVLSVEIPVGKPRPRGIVS